MKNVCGWIIFTSNILIANGGRHKMVEKDIKW